MEFNKFRGDSDEQHLNSKNVNGNSKNVIGNSKNVNGNSKNVNDELNHNFSNRKKLAF